MVAGHSCWCGVEFFGEELEGAGDSWAVGPVQGDGDRVGGVVDLAAEVEQASQDRPVLVGVVARWVGPVGRPWNRLDNNCSPERLG